MRRERLFRTVAPLLCVSVDRMRRGILTIPSDHLIVLVDRMEETLLVQHPGVESLECFVRIGDFEHCTEPFL
jgi:hypothetical protein